MHGIEITDFRYPAQLEILGNVYDLEFDCEATGECDIVSVCNIHLVDDKEDFYRIRFSDFLQESLQKIIKKEVPLTREFQDRVKDELKEYEEQNK